MTTNTNGRTERKSLAGQLDRLDRILDGLSDGLNEAVANAVKQAVTAAVEAALVEVLTSAELQRRLRAEPESKPGLVRRAASAVCHAAKGCWSRAAALVGRCRQNATEAVSALRQGGAVVVAQVRRGMTTFARLVWLGWFAARGLVRRFRKPLLVVATAGTAVGVAGYLAGPTVLSLASAIVVFFTAMVAGAMLRVRRLLREIGWGEWDAAGAVRGR